MKWKAELIRVVVGSVGLFIIVIAALSANDYFEKKKMLASVKAMMTCVVGQLSTDAKDQFARKRSGVNGSLFFTPTYDLISKVFEAAGPICRERMMPMPGILANSKVDFELMAGNPTYAFLEILDEDSEYRHMAEKYRKVRQEEVAEEKVRQDAAARVRAQSLAYLLKPAVKSMPLLTQAAESAPVTTQPQVPAQVIWSPSFNCALGSSNSERLICSSRELSEADVTLANAYKAELEISTDKYALRKEQNAWLRNERDVCLDIDCLSKVYRQRIAKLSR